MVARGSGGEDLEREGVMKGRRVLDRRNPLAELWHRKVTTVKSNVCMFQSHLRKSPCILSGELENAELPRS